MIYHNIARTAATAGLAVLLIAGGVSSAAAQPDPGEPTWAVQASRDDNCALHRIGVQFVRCDRLTGAGVRSPSWISELGTEVGEVSVRRTLDPMN